MDGINGIDYAHKARFSWIAMIRLPEFVTREVFARARQAYSAKHPEADVLVVRRSDSNIDVVAPDGVFTYTERSGGRIRR